MLKFQAISGSLFHFSLPIFRFIFTKDFLGVKNTYKYYIFYCLQFNDYFSITNTHTHGL